MTNETETEGRLGLTADRAGSPSGLEPSGFSRDACSSLTHTPGPWEFEGFNVIYNDGVAFHDFGAILNADGSETIANVCGNDPDLSGMSREEVEANAQLIAAAPDLLEALKSYFAHDWCEKIGMWEEIAQAVISRAEGRVSDINPKGENPKGSSAEGMMARPASAGDAQDVPDIKALIYDKVADEISSDPDIVSSIGDFALDAIDELTARGILVPASALSSYKERIERLRSDLADVRYALEISKGCCLRAEDAESRLSEMEKALEEIYRIASAPLQAPYINPGKAVKEIARSALRSKGETTGVPGFAGRAGGAEPSTFPGDWSDVDPDDGRASLASLDRAGGADAPEPSGLGSDERSSLTQMDWEGAKAAARKAIYGTDGRGMIGGNRRFLDDRVARAIMQGARSGGADAPSLPRHR